MSSWSIQRYMDFQKNQTRRTKDLAVINENPDAWEFTGIRDGLAWFRNGLNVSIRLPYGNVGDMLYFKETYRIGRSGIVYKADIPDELQGHFNWKSSMFMPRDNARFCNISITGVRIERLLDISEEDAMNEGLYDGRPTWQSGDTYRKEYFKVWDSINGKTMPHEKNPWVWVYDFPFREEEE